MNANERPRDDELHRGTLETARCKHDAISRMISRTFRSTDQRNVYATNAERARAWTKVHYRLLDASWMLIAGLFVKK